MQPAFLGGTSGPLPAAHPAFLGAGRGGEEEWKDAQIVLFGSYARDGWVDEPESGYQSDFDLLIVVSHEDLTDIADYW